MRKIGQKYTQAELDTMDDKFAADMRELDSMPRPADTPEEMHYTRKEPVNMTKKEIVNFIRTECGDELNAMFDAIDDCAKAIASGLIAEHNADSNTLDRAEKVFYTWLSNFIETYN